MKGYKFQVSEGKTVHEAVEEDMINCKSGKNRALNGVEWNGQTLKLTKLALDRWAKDITMLIDDDIKSYNKIHLKLSKYRIVSHFFDVIFVVILST